MSGLLFHKCFYGLTVLLIVQGEHFFGGRISWEAVQPNTTNFTSVQIKLTQIYSWYNSLATCGYNSISDRYLYCLNGTTSYKTNISASGKCISYDINLPFITAESIHTLTYAANTSIVLFYDSSTWSKNLLNNRNSSLIAFIKLTTRRDNGRINSSPFTNMPAVITLPINTPQIIRIPMFDLDGDIVKCRRAIKNSTYYSPNVDECSGVCKNLPNAQLYTSSNRDNNCTLVVNMTSTNYYAVAIQIEDFMPSASDNKSLSSIPLQFVIRGISDACDLPSIIGELTNGAIITVSANTQFSTSIIAKTGCNQTKIIKFSTEMLPLGITSTSSIIQRDSKTYSAIFTWIPTIDQIGIKQLYCTIATDDDNRQSTQYCLNFIVVKKTNSPSNSESTDISLLLGLSLGLGLPLFLLAAFTTFKLIYSKSTSRKFRQQKIAAIKSLNSVGTTTGDLHGPDVSFPSPMSACSNEFQSNSMTMTRTIFIPIDYTSPSNSFSNWNSQLAQTRARQALVDNSRLSVWSDE